MRDLHTNPILYYILILLMVGVWPAVVGFKYLPQMTEQRDEWKENVVDANDLILELLSLDPDRLSYAEDSNQPAEFEYENATDRVARGLGLVNQMQVIPGRRSGNKQTAEVGLKDVGIIQATQFLSTLQMRWDNLQCSRVILRKQKEVKDRWDIDMTFIYYY